MLDHYLLLLLLLLRCADRKVRRSPQAWRTTGLILKTSLVKEKPHQILAELDCKVRSI
jgi:hypothetical protein